MKGWVYVITNKAMLGLVKIGYSMKDPDLRATELNHTGTPHPYVVDYEVLVEEPRSIEQKVHLYLREFREGKEWFRCSSEKAIAAIKFIAGEDVQVENFKRANRERAEEIRTQQLREEKNKLAADEERKKREVLITEKRREIVSYYDDLLQKVPPQTNFWVCFIGIFITLFITIAVISPEINTTSNFLLSTIGSFATSHYKKLS